MMSDKSTIVSLQKIKSIIEDVKNALDDDGLEIYADELYGAFNRLDALIYTIKNKPVTSVNEA